MPSWSFEVQSIKPLRLTSDTGNLVCLLSSMGVLAPSWSPPSAHYPSSHPSEVFTAAPSAHCPSTTRPCFHRRVTPRGTKFVPGSQEEISASRNFPARGSKIQTFSDKSELRIFLPAGVFRVLSDLSENAEP